MSMISEQIKELRELADDMEKYVGIRPKPHILRESTDTIETLSAKLQAVDMENGVGWRPISEYSRDKYDWVLVKYFDGEEECVPQVAELRSDGKWHVSTDFDGDFTIPSWFDIRYFFDMQQLDRS